ncbi:MAG TPA: DUF4080 domain-containing protein [Tepidisphaeraceae bacterium]|jgi:radical SAM superfamily enzyme YgiQ (UPF0313 family)|nr:DUF4080 domain-containing protein [Tepidisphaeraceae bacterium]
MPQIVLTTLNARYAHASFGLRYLMANLGPLAAHATMIEFDIKRPIPTAAQEVLKQEPIIVGIGVYIWNVTQSTELVRELKRLRPNLTIVLGGPEVSYETNQQEIAHLADYVITGEADLAFAALCDKLLTNRRPLTKVIAADLPEFAAKQKALQLAPSSPTVALPYDLYTDVDIAQRVIYVEASRGCPFKCEFCLSSLDVPVRNVPTDAFLAAMQSLLDRGVRRFKFVDRTFNLNLNISRAILRFFLDRLSDDLFLHFEMIPDRLPDPLRELITQFPPGTLQFEVGIQTFNEDVSALISRRQDVAKIQENLTWLREQTGVHVHADLIVGLPGEDIASFARGFDRLVRLRPQEIQVGMLKRLRGTPIVRHDATWEMVYDPAPPYEVRQTKLIDAGAMLGMKRFARFWDLIANSGNFVETTARVLDNGPSPFASFRAMTEWLFARFGRAHGIPLHELAEGVLRFCVDWLSLDERATAESLWRDWQRAGRGDRPVFLRDFVNKDDARAARRRHAGALPSRQARHLPI